MGDRFAARPGGLRAEDVRPGCITLEFGLGVVGVVLALIDGAPCVVLSPIEKREVGPIEDPPLLDHVASGSVVLRMPNREMAEAVADAIAEHSQRSSGVRLQEWVLERTTEL